MPIIYIECTTAYETELNTGIQRVVRNVIQNSGVVAPRYGYAVLPVALRGSELFEVNAEDMTSESLRAREHRPAKVRDRNVSRISLRIAKYLARRGLHLIVIVLPFDPVRRLVYGLRYRLSRLPSALWRLVGFGPAAPEHVKPIEISRGDILLLLDASWVKPNLWAAIRKFKHNGGRVVAMIHDLIPLDYPQTCDPEHIAVFKAWIRKLVRVADAFICNSNAVAQRLSDYISDQSLTHQVPIAYFHLGSGLDFVRKDDAVRPAFKALFSVPWPVFIVVGSIEPRKNHVFVLDGFEQLWRAGVKASLAVIGGHGWLSEDILARIAKHPEFGRQVFLMRDASDSELDYAYRNASALVTASKIEGFGLPIVEAFQYGLPVLCSDIPVFREIAAGKARFFSLDDPRHLAEALTDFMRAKAGTPEKAPQRWLTWRESTEQLFSALMRILPPSKAPG